jgi:hypothetical protein
MKKLRLDLDKLTVEAFEAGEAAEARGTVRGHLPETHPNVCPGSANWYCTGVGTCTLYVQYCYPEW